MRSTLHTRQLSKKAAIPQNSGAEMNEPSNV